MQCFQFIALFVASFVAQSAFAEVKLSFMTTSFANPSAEVFLVKGGRLWHKRALVQGAVLIQHDDTLFLYDAGLGSSIDAQFAEFDWLDRKIFAHSEVNPVVTQLVSQGITQDDIDFIVPSHLHWDHISGLPDFPKTPIWVQSKELGNARESEHSSTLPDALSEQLNWQAINLNAQPFLGFKHSLDIFGDGTVVLVGLPGHTVGQLGLYVETSPTQRYFFIADASWTLEGVIHDKARAWVIKRLVKLNHNDDQTLETLHALHELSKRDPHLIIVPMHDENVVAALPAFPEGL